MKKILVLLLATFVAGCATPPVVLKRAPTNYCEPGQATNCRPWTAGEITGAGSRGHIEQPEEPK